MNTSAIINSLKKEFKKELPGKDIQYKMAPEGRINVQTPGKPKKSGVLILLYAKHADLYTVFIKRSFYQGVHSGQVSLPGGKQEESDYSLSDTAIREAREEIGIDPHKVQLLGELTKLHIPVSQFEVYPYVGYYEGVPNFLPDFMEVAYIIEVNLMTLLSKDICKTSKQLHNGQNIIVPYYFIAGEQIWGATAMIVSEFLALFREAMNITP